MRATLHMLFSIVALYGLRHDRAGRITTLVVLTLRRHHPCHVARLQPKHYRHAGRDGGGDSHHELIDLLLRHNRSLVNSFIR